MICAAQRLQDPAKFCMKCVADFISSAFWLDLNLNCESASNSSLFIQYFGAISLRISAKRKHSNHVLKVSDSLGKVRKLVPIDFIAVYLKRSGSTSRAVYIVPDKPLHFSNTLICWYHWVKRGSQYYSQTLGDFFRVY